MSKIELVKEFHEKYNQLVNDKITLIDYKTAILRVSLIQEEFNEYKDALKRKDLVGVIDALIDLEYVVLGTMVSHGFNANTHSFLFDVVHNSNMTKDNNKDKNGKIVKGNNYVEPEPIIKAFLAVLKNRKV